MSDLQKLTWTYCFVDGKDLLDDEKSGFNIGNVNKESPLGVLLRESERNGEEPGDEEKTLEIAGINIPQVFVSNKAGELSLFSYHSGLCLLIKSADRRLF